MAAKAKKAAAVEKAVGLTAVTPLERANAWVNALNARKVIPVDVVLGIKELRAEKAALDLRSKLIEGALDLVEPVVIARVEAEVPVERGAPSCAVSVSERRSVKWREVFEEWKHSCPSCAHVFHVGKAIAEVVLAGTVPTRVKKLIINGADAK